MGHRRTWSFRDILRANGLAHVLRDVVERRAWREDPTDAVLLQTGHVRLWDDPATEEQHVVQPFLTHQLGDPREEIVVRAGEERQTDHVGVLLERGLDDLLRRLMHPRVDHLHASVAQGACHDLRAAVMAVEPGLRNDDADRAFQIVTPRSGPRCSSQWRYE